MERRGVMAEGKILACTVALYSSFQENNEPKKAKQLDVVQSYIAVFHPILQLLHTLQ